MKSSGGKKILKWVGYFTGFLLLLLVALHFWLVNHAEQIIEDLVKNKSNGQLNLQLKNLKFNYFSKHMELQELSVHTTDTIQANTTYRFYLKNLKLDVKSLLPVIFKKQLLIDTLMLIDPEVEIVRLRPDNNRDTTTKKEISISEEMGKIYNSIQTALEELQVKRFEIDNAKFSLQNKIQPGIHPVVITGLHFHINNISVDASKYTGSRNSFLGEDMVLRTRNQDILFPDNRTRLAFSRFRINIRKKLIEFDSCTFTKKNKDGVGASYSVFFDLLKLTSFDFNTLAESDLFKADSVICKNPVIDLSFTAQNKSKITNENLQPDSLIHLLNMDMQFNYIVVQNANLQVQTQLNNKTNFIKSENNDFEIRGIKVDHRLPYPVSLDYFQLASGKQVIKLPASGLALQFDNLEYKNGKLILNNLDVTSKKNMPLIKMQLQSLELSDLNWHELVFNQRFAAKGIHLFQPIIEITDSASPVINKKFIQPFQFIRRASGYMKIETLQISNGELISRSNKTGLTSLNNFNILLSVSKLLKAASVNNLSAAVHQFDFSTGSTENNNITVRFRNGQYAIKSNQLIISVATVRDKKSGTFFSADDVMLNGLTLLDENKTISLNKLSWQNGNLDLILNETKNSPDAMTGNNFFCRDIHFQNTSIRIKKGDQQIATKLNRFAAADFSFSDSKEINFRDLSIEGEKSEVKDSGYMITTGQYRFNHNKHSEIKTVTAGIYSNAETQTVKIPHTSFTPDLQLVLNGKINLDNLVINNPTVNWFIQKTASSESNTKFSDLHITRIEINNPLVTLVSNTSNDPVNIRWAGGNNGNTILIENLRTIDSKELHAGKFYLQADNFSMDGKKLNSIHFDKPWLHFNAGDIIVKNENNKLRWGATINELNSGGFSIRGSGKNNDRFELKTLTLKNMNLNSENINSPTKLLQSNSLYSIEKLTGSWKNDKTNFSWNNMAYDSKDKQLAVDSLVVSPVLAKDSFMAHQRFQKDYMQLHSGKIKISGIDPVNYLQDSLIKAHTIEIENAELNISKDKRLPFNTGKIKPLPVIAILNIPIRLTVDTLKYKDVNLIYSEFNDKTQSEGVVQLNKMYGIVFPIRTRDWTSTDSLNIRMNAFLMDSIWMRLRIRESYADSLAGFFVSLRIKPTSLEKLNSFLPQLSSIELEKGFVDTLSMRAMANEYLSIGEMKLLYHDLKIRFLKNDVQTKKNFLDGLVTFVASNFIIRKKNASRDGRVFFIRHRDRSIINYILKMALTGMASSAGARNSKKLLRQYKKELKLRNLPPIDFDL